MTSEGFEYFRGIFGEGDSGFLELMTGDMI
jgi:hypothetical protein